MALIQTRPTYSTVKQLLDYDKKTGLLTWKRTRSRRAKVGDEAGTVHKDGHIAVGITGRSYPAMHLTYLLVMGAWPEKRLAPLNGNKLDLRWDNISEITPVMTKRAIYQRNLRADYKRLRAMGARV